MLLFGHRGRRLGWSSPPYEVRDPQLDPVGGEVMDEQFEDLQRGRVCDRGAA
jgi:hypothetical protein